MSDSKTNHLGIKISVLTPTIRGKEALEPNRQALEQQTFKDFEWIVEEGDGKKHDLNAAFNRMLRKAKGELIVFYEDYTKCLPTGLEAFWQAYQENPNTFFTAPLGKTLDWQTIHWDWRAHKDTEGKELAYNTWEIDWGSAPKAALFEVGGFDEELDKYWSGDNVNVGYRAYLNGYKFRNLFSNPAVAYDHNKVTDHPFIKNFNPKFQRERLDSFTPGTKLPYLD